MFELRDYLNNKENKKNGIKDIAKYICLAFRPIGNILICILLIAAVSIPCIISLKINPNNNIASSVLTGVIASGMVALVIEISNNIRRSKQRLVVLHEYLSAVANYEQFIEWSADSLPDDIEYEERYNPMSNKLTKRLRALAKIELEIIPPIDTALDNGRDFLSYKEINLLTQMEEASNDIAKITEGHIMDMVDKNYAVYEVLKEPLKSEIQNFSDIVGISLIDKNLQSVIYDYYMENYEKLSETEQSLVKYDLHTIDESVKGLRKIVAWEPVYSDDMIPFKIRMKKYGVDIEKEEKRVEEELEKEAKRKMHATVKTVNSDKKYVIYETDNEKLGVFFLGEKCCLKAEDRIIGILDEPGVGYIIVNDEDIVRIAVLGCDLTIEEAYKYAHIDISEE